MGNSKIKTSVSCGNVLLIAWHYFSNLTLQIHELNLILSVEYF